MLEGHQLPRCVTPLLTAEAIYLRIDASSNVGNLNEVHKVFLVASERYTEECDENYVSIFPSQWVHRISIDCNVDAASCACWATAMPFGQFAILSHST